MDVFLTDGRLVDHSLSANPYTDNAFDMPAQYVRPDGLHLRLYGRSADGTSVVVEKKMESLSIALNLDPQHQGNSESEAGRCCDGRGHRFGHVHGWVVADEDCHKETVSQVVTQRSLCVQRT